MLLILQVYRNASELLSCVNAIKVETEAYFKILHISTADTKTYFCPHVIPSYILNCKQSKDCAKNFPYHCVSKKRFLIVFTRFPMFTVSGYGSHDL